jgi:hypothetical protein
MKKKDLRLPALIRFAAAISILNIAGYLFLGFEQSYATVFVALATGYLAEFIMEVVNAKSQKRPFRFKGGWKAKLSFILPAHISALAVSMLTFVNQNLMGVVFGVLVAILSKTIFRATINGRLRHFLNPSNTGIAMSFMVFPWIGAAPPYQFSEATSGAADWIILGALVCLGSFLNYKYTKKIPLILSWLIFFVFQAVVRTTIFQTDTLAALAPMTGIAFLLFTFYMVSDPSTTPFKKRNQIFFGAAVAVVYGISMELHLVFNLFISLMFVCALRGVYYWIYELRNKKVNLKELSIGLPFEGPIMAHKQLTN